MPIPTVTIQAAECDQLYCPFTGKALCGDNGIQGTDPLLFAYYGNAGEYTYISESLVSLLRDNGIECSTDNLDIAPEEVAEKLDANRPRSTFLNRESFPLAAISRMIAEYSVACGVLPPDFR